MVDERKIWAKVIGTVIFVLMEIAALSMLRHSGSLQDIWISKASHRVMAWVWGGFDNIGHYFSLKTENQDRKRNQHTQRTLRPVSQEGRDQLQDPQGNRRLNPHRGRMPGYN